MDLVDFESSDEFVKCKYCGKVFLTEELLQIHMGRFHKKDFSSSSISSSTNMRRSNSNTKTSNNGHLMKKGGKSNLGNKEIQITSSPVFLQDLQATGRYSLMQKRSIKIKTNEHDIIDGLDLTYSYDDDDDDDGDESVSQENSSSILFKKKNNELNTSDLVVPIKTTKKDISCQQNKVTEKRNNKHSQSDFSISYTNSSADISSNKDPPMSPEEKYYLDAIKKAKELLNPYTIRRKNNHNDRNKIQNKQIMIGKENNKDSSNRRKQQNVINKYEDKINKKDISKNYYNTKGNYSYDEQDSMESKSDRTDGVDYSEESMSISQSEDSTNKKYNSHLTINPLSRQSLYKVNVYKPNTANPLKVITDSFNNNNPSQSQNKTELKSFDHKQNTRKECSVIPTTMKIPFVKPLNMKQQYSNEQGNHQKNVSSPNDKINKNLIKHYKDIYKNNDNTNEENKEYFKQIDQTSVTPGSPVEITPIKTSKSLNVRQIKTPTEGIFFSSITRTSCILHIKIQVKNIPPPPTVYINKGGTKELLSEYSYEKETNSRTMSLVLHRNRIQIYSCILKYAPFVCITLEDKDLTTKTEYEYRCSVNGTNSVVGRMSSM